MARLQAFLQLAVLLLLAAFPSALGQTNTPPFFLFPLYVFQINEEVPGGTIVGSLEGDDLDGDILMFSVPENSINSGRFDVRTFGGNMAEIFVLNDTILDRELLTPDNEPLSLFVRLSDGIDHGVTVEVEVFIYLRDTNDVAPEFTNLPNLPDTIIEWPENTPVGTELFVVAATDRDDGVNALILYNFSNPTDMFTIDVSTGVLELAELLDFETERSHRIPISASDRGDPTRSTVRDLVIYVIDVNDEPPVFEQPEYFVEIHENLTRGENITRVRARDGDEGVNDDIVYSILAGNLEINGTESFAIDNVTGVISVNVESLDRDEAHAEYTLTVMATEANDDDRSSTVDVEIVVFDINDNSPFFQQSSYAANVSESDGLGEVVVIVTAQDIDSGTNADFTFRLEDLILNSTVPLPFAIEHDVNSGEGRIVINVPRLDFETTESYFFRVIATEVIDEEPRNGSATVTVYVNNVNDNDPIFSSDNYTAMVAEEGGPEFVITVTATDADAGTFGDVQYRLVSGDMGRFNITEDSGEISTTERLNFEDVEEYVIVVEAFDSAEEPTEIRRTRVNLHVEVININDNQPSFASPEVNVTVEEQRPVPEAVYTVVASDDDGDLTELTYEIVNGSRGRFQLNADNVIVTTEELDYDGDPSLRNYQLEIVVNDTEQTNTLFVNIYVMDINDNDPEFENDTYTFEVQENMNISTFVDVVFAADRDSELFGAVEYRLDGPGAESFYINATTGEIFTAVELNREDVQQYDLTATATDLDPVNPRSAEASVIITVLDENDNVPVFDQNVYLFEVEENTAVFSEQVRATDMDAGSNSDITYSIVSGNTNETFEIDTYTGELRRNPQRQIDREFQENYRINVSATDGGSPALTSYALAVITVLDQNDDIPHFAQTSYVSTILEDAAEGSTVRQLIAEDEDDGSNGQLRYTITITADAPPSSGVTGTFVININTGTVTTQGTFDRERFAGPYSIQVRVEDGGFPTANNGTTDLTVFIQDINDNPPRYPDVPYIQTVSEGLPPGYPLLLVRAMDDDEPNTANSEVHYTITNVIPTNEVGPFEDGIPPIYHFSVNETSGRLYTNVTLDYEAIRSYSVEVTASDRGDPQRSSAVFVTMSVEDINDQPPVFSESDYEFNITEDTPINTRFEGIEATDRDSDMHADIMYSTSISENFTINSETGELVLVASLDFEEIEEYVFTVNATDGVFTDTANVVVRVIDVNDHTPTFDMTSFTVSVDEGNYTDSPVQITTLTASDEDSGPRGTVTYSITAGDDDDIFYIGSASGSILVRGNVDREMTERFTLTVEARDGGMPPAVSSTELIVEVVDVNDETPTFDMSSYEATVEENLPVNETVIRVLATDGDEGDNGVVLYSIDDNVNFRIDSGLILTNIEFNFEALNTYTIIVTARDNSSSPLESNATVTVRILDRNDNQPSFTSVPSSPVTISEDLPVGVFVAMVTATDVDSTSNGEVRYQIANGEGKFAIDVNGTITVAASLDREMVPEYNLTIIAMDRGSPPESNSTIVVVTLSDINDRIPTFTQTSYSFLVQEGVPLLTTVATLQVLDGDSENRGRLDFDVDDSRFDIQETQVDSTLWNVEVRNLQELNYEDVTSYNLTVTARDNGVPREVGSTTVLLTILDTNDNSPVFSMPDGYTIMVPEEAATGTAIGTLVATDDDGGLGGTVSYTFDPSTDAAITSTFAINNRTGVITLLAPLDFEARDSYLFLVDASDLGVTPQTTGVTVTVEVLDTNEFAPVFDRAVYTASVQEEGATIQLVVQVNATERDVGSGVLYRIAAGDSDDQFEIDNAGIITTIALNREAVARYILTVEARDTATSPRTSFAQVDVTVLDTNDNSPEFTHTSYEYSVTENAATGDDVTGQPLIMATDEDEGTNAEIRYSLTGGPFNIDADTGAVTVAPGADLDRETTPFYDLQLTASDRASSPMSSTVNLRVTITDVNDNSPVFDPDEYATSVPENSPSGVVVDTVLATDPDGDGIAFSIMSGDDSVEPKFTIRNSGAILTTSNSLNREDRDSYILTILATDDGNPQRSSSVEVTITVEDRNDNAPEFVGGPNFDVSVEEDNELELRVFTAVTTDDDINNNADVMFDIIHGNDDGIFRIDSQGDIFAAAMQLDFENETVHPLRIIAVDRASDPADRLTSTATVTVRVQDVNDNQPVFTEMNYETTVPENATIGETVLQVTADDIDTGVGGDVTYFFQGSISVFIINPNTGVITVNGELDSETVRRYTLVVEGRDSGDPQRTGSANVIINVMNINDNNPMFDRSFYITEVQEDVSMGTTVITLTASDPDSSEVFYSIASGNEGGYFLINPNNGVVQTATDLDRETVAIVSLVISARDNGVPPQIGNTTLQIVIGDVNDEAPMFLEEVYYASILENSPTGIQVLPEINGTTTPIEARDADEPNTQNSDVLYSLIGENRDLFSIDFNTGIVTVALGADLDRERRSMLTLTIMAEDGAVPPETSTVLLHIEILDENDESPVFSQPFGYAISIPENTSVGTVITTSVDASDPDTGAGGTPLYSITTANPLGKLTNFNISSTTGEITLAEPLDRETNTLIVLTVTAQDQASPVHSTSVSVQVTVTDVNDNPPSFSRDIYTVNINEFVPTGASAFQITADDPDIGLNAEVVYSLSTIDGPFIINPSTGLITTTSALDHENDDSHTITVQACDRGDPQMCSNATVIFTVLDTNDETPTFDLPIYQVDIFEDIAEEDIIVQPVAIDRDSGTNAEITYSIEDEPTGLFAINETNGRIYLTTRRRRQTMPPVFDTTYTFTVVATDGGTPSLTGSATVRINAKNETEHPFRFNTSYFYFSVAENTAGFFELLELHPFVTFDVQFDPDVAGNPFRLLANRILLPVGETLDREERELYTYIVMAVDDNNFSPPQTAYTSVTIRVTDVNDEPPEFLSIFHQFNLQENQTAPVSVGSVPAIDRDEDSTLTFTITAGDPDNEFDIDGQGNITTRVELDREVTAEYTLTVTVSDSMFTDTATVRVIVDDINDVTPTFTQSVYDVSILENSPQGTSVTTVEANDEDAGANGEVSYRIAGGDVGVFAVDSSSGVITTTATLDFEQEQSYFLMIEATDRLRSSMARVNIQVEDFNDCPPVFVLGTPMSMTVPENQQDGSVVVTFEVEDCDSDLNGVNGTRFSIISGDSDGSFFINEVSGVLVTQRRLNREDVSTYQLTIQARDSAVDNSMSSITQLTVVVTDVNDNIPVFVEDSFSTTVSEGEAVNEPILTVLATDLDATSNGDVRYSLENDEGIFRIEEGTGVISLMNSLDREVQDRHTLTVIATDRGAEPQSSNATVFIDVADANDNPPVIQNILSGATFIERNEETEINTDIFTVNATDADAGLNGEIVFSLEDASMPFGINPQSGVIRNSEMLDYEEQVEYTVVVVARDQGVPQLTGVATLIIRITDSNDNPPVFSRPSYTGEQEENVTVGTSILAVTATDNDQSGTTNAEIEYSIVGGCTPQFCINPSTGDIFNTVVLDREERTYYFLTVLANNSFSDSPRPMFDVANVTITITDINDEVPYFDMSSYSLVVSESASVGELLLTVIAEDDDETTTPNSEVIYSLSRIDNNPFHLDQNNGEFTIQNPLDYETQNQYELTVIAEDKGVPPQTNSTTISVTVTDVNDERPIFEESTYTASVSELQPSPFIPLVLADLSYVDRDGETNRDSVITIRSVTGPDGQEITDTSLFTVTTNTAAATGQIILNRAVDREQLASYRVEMRVTNTELGVGDFCGGLSPCSLSDTSYLELTVVDENDNAPRFDQSAYSAEVSTTADPGTSVLSVRATDADAGNFGVVRYRLVDSAGGRFRIDEESGTIFTRVRLEGLDGVTYPLSVVAFDNLDQSPSQSSQVTISVLILNDFQRVRIVFTCGIEAVLTNEDFILNTLQNISGLTIVVESIETGVPSTRTNFTFHAINPATNEIVDYYEFLDRIEGREDELTGTINEEVCQIAEIVPAAGPVVYPDALDAATIVILVLCVLLVAGAITCLILALHQRYAALHDVRNKLLADVFYGSPGASSMIENMQQENYQLEALELKAQGGTRQNPMFVHPYDNWAGIDTSGVESVGESSSMKRDNPLYESQEIRMEMFADVSDEETEGEVDDAELLAAALQDDEEEEDTSVTAI